VATAGLEPGSSYLAQDGVTEPYPTGNKRSKSYLVNMILISLNTSNFSSNVRISRELSIRSDENYVVSSMVTTTVVLLEI
jgi:hypothetical protein